MTGQAEDRAAVSEHYGRGDLAARILEALRAAGKDLDALAVEDLSPVDQFHTGGREATLDLARRAGITTGTRVLDVGGGLGGPARTLASEFGCTVEVLDLTEEFCRAGETLTAHTGLSDSVSFRQGSALDMPYPDASFDAGVDAAQLYEHRGQGSALRGDPPRVAPRRAPGAARDHGRPRLPHPLPGPVGAGSLDQPPPTPRGDPSPDLRHRLRGAPVGRRNDPSLRLVSNDHPQPRPKTHRTPPHLLFGADAADIFRNQARNLQERRISIVQAVFDRP